ncbi:hypothetical protein YC2023_085619 [Brassica napus]
MVRVRPPEVSSFSPLFSPRLSPCSCLWSVGCVFVLKQPCARLGLFGAVSRWRILSHDLLARGDVLVTFSGGAAKSLLVCCGASVAMSGGACDFINWNREPYGSSVSFGGGLLQRRVGVGYAGGVDGVLVGVLHSRLWLFQALFGAPLAFPASFSCHHFEPSDCEALSPFLQFSKAARGIPVLSCWGGVSLVLSFHPSTGSMVAVPSLCLIGSRRCVLDGLWWCFMAYASYFRDDAKSLGIRGNKENLIFELFSSMAENGIFEDGLAECVGFSGQAKLAFERMGDLSEVIHDTVQVMSKYGESSDRKGVLRPVMGRNEDVAFFEME